MSFQTREEWLEAAATVLRDEVFAHSGQPEGVPERLHFLCSFPVGSPKAIGQAFDRKASRDGETYHITISPRLDAPYEVLDTLVHEMVHACLFKDHPDHAHGPEFRRLGRAVGLARPWRSASVEPGHATQAVLLRLEKTLGPYPHSALVPVKVRKPSASSWIRLVSTNDDSYKIVISPKVLETHGAPTDPWGDEMVQLQK